MPIVISYDDPRLVGALAASSGQYQARQDQVNQGQQDMAMAQQAVAERNRLGLARDQLIGQQQSEAQKASAALDQQTFENNRQVAHDQLDQQLNDQRQKNDAARLAMDQQSRDPAYLAQVGQAAGKQTVDTQGQLYDLQAKRQAEIDHAKALEHQAHVDQLTQQISTDPSLTPEQKAQAKLYVGSPDYAKFRDDETNRLRIQADQAAKTDAADSKGRADAWQKVLGDMGQQYRYSQKVLDDGNTTKAIKDRARTDMENAKTLAKVAQVSFSRAKAGEAVPYPHETSEFGMGTVSAGAATTQPTATPGAALPGAADPVIPQIAAAAGVTPQQASNAFLQTVYAIGSGQTVDRAFVVRASGGNEKLADEVTKAVQAKIQQAPAASAGGTATSRPSLRVTQDGTPIVDSAEQLGALPAGTRVMALNPKTGKYEPATVR